MVVFTARHVGETVTVDLPDAPPPTYADACRALARALDLDVQTVRVHGARECRGRTASVDDDAIALPSDCATRKYMVSGTTREIVDAINVMARTDARIRDFEEETARERSRRERTSSAAASTSKYFGEIEVLDVSDGMPSRERAMEVLRRLASDPGITGVMDAHGWYGGRRVGKLCEMPPEGKVSLGEMCVLGYNVNNGREIHLRLRTDDYLGFRDYVTVRKTLLHELAHNVHSNHGPEFRALNSQLNAECERFDWKRASSARVTSRAAEAYQPRDADARVVAPVARSLGAVADVARTTDDVRARRLAKFAAFNAADAADEASASSRAGGVDEDA